MSEPKKDKEPQKDEVPDAALAILERLTAVVEHLTAQDKAKEDAKGTTKKDDGSDPEPEREPRRKHWFFG